MTNRRFGHANKFGTTNKFGASSGEVGVNRNNITFALEVDWAGTGFTGENEAQNLGGTSKGRITDWNERRGREFFFNSSGQGFQSVDVGRLTIELLNTDRRFDPFFSSGALFSYLAGNQKLKFRAKDELTNTLYSDFVGYIDDIKPKYGDVDKVIITVFDGLKKLKDKNISSSTIGTSVQYDNQIEAALTAAGWTDDRSIDLTVSDTMAYHWFRGNSAFWEIDQLVQAAFGLFFVDMDGVATYKSRIASDESILTLTEDDIDYNYHIQSPTPREVIKNKVTVYARARKLQTGIELWRMTDIPSIANGVSSPIWAKYSYNGEEIPATSVTEPVENTDYEANDNSDGSGTDRSANFSFSRTGFATSSKLIPTNSGGAAYLTLLKLRGNGITADKYTFAQDSDDASIALYGERELVINSDWLQDINTAIEQVALLLGRLSTPHFFPRVKVRRSSIGKMYAADLFDLVTLNFPTHDISAEMRVGYIERSWNISEPNVIDTIMYFEPNLLTNSSGTWIFPATMGVTTIFG